MPPVLSRLWFGSDLVLLALLTVRMFRGPYPAPFNTLVSMWLWAFCLFILARAYHQRSKEPRQPLY